MDDVAAAAAMAVAEKKDDVSNGKMEGSSRMMRWERFVPRMGLRVLLVESDDSTRQIIGALLRKCNYKVATVPDGLKAWEVLKARPHEIDLILTEVELPLISGYALLTLIMELEICKNIPVIMMSKYDSVNMVYKCMLKGASDFLVKPIRINELKNLWQHVWKRQSLHRGLGRLDESVGQQKPEATAENDATSDHSRSSKSKKGSDAKSSCGQPELEAESVEVACAREYPLQLELGKSSISDPKLPNHSNCDDSAQHLSTPKLSYAVAGSEDNGVYNNNETLKPQIHGGNEMPYTEASNTADIPTVDIPAHSCREPVNLFGALNSSCSLNDRANKLDSPQLGLSLRRFCPGVLENNDSGEKQMLIHSSTSAFTRFVKKMVPTFTLDPSSVSNTQEEDRENSGDNLCEDAPCSISNSQEPSLLHDGKLTSLVSLPSNLTKEVENDDRNAGYTSTFPPTVCTPLPLAPSANHHLNYFHQFSLDIINAGHSLENCQHQEVVGPTRCENEIGKIETRHDLNLERSMRREAALHKFRLKRKERCFEKKVRYESRKKLAEKRPRVKGQFVRQDLPTPCKSGVNSALR